MYFQLLSGTIWRNWKACDLPGTRRYNLQINWQDKRDVSFNIFLGMNIVEFVQILIYFWDEDSTTVAPGQPLATNHGLKKQTFATNSHHIGPIVRNFSHNFYNRINRSPDNRKLGRKRILLILFVNKILFYFAFQRNCCSNIFWCIRLSLSYLTSTCVRPSLHYFNIFLCDRPSLHYFNIFWCIRSSLGLYAENCLMWKPVAIVWRRLSLFTAIDR